MKKNKYWFTFIEIIVSISILSFVSFFAISWFMRNFENQNLNEELSFFTDILYNLEKNIWKESIDYELYLLTGAFYYYTTNKNNQEFTKFNNYTWTINIWFTWYLNTINLDKFTIFSWVFNDKNMDFNFSKPWNYEILTFSWLTKLNILYLNYYSKINKNDLIFLSKIKDESGNTYSWMVIKNQIWQKRQFLTNTWQIIDSDINLTFENNSSEITLKLIK